MYRNFGKEGDVRLPETISHSTHAELVLFSSLLRSSDEVVRTQVPSRGRWKHIRTQLLAATRQLLCGWYDMALCRLLKGLKFIASGLEPSPVTTSFARELSHVLGYDSRLLGVVVLGNMGPI